MSPSTVVTGALLGGFILYLAAKNRLTVYLQFLTGQATYGTGTVGGATSGNVVGVTGTPGASVSATVTQTAPNASPAGATGVQ